jgi:hypothetical protein
VSLCVVFATLRVARIALVTRCRRPRSETKSVSPRSSSDQRGAIRVVGDAPRRADRARDPLPSSSLGDGRACLLARPPISGARSGDLRFVGRSIP